MEPIFFASPAEFRTWMEKNHEQETELLVGYHKKHTGTPSLTWAESVDVALCFGWIDGIRKSIDDTAYTIRFTPRKARSIWSNVNIKRVGELTEMGLMQPAGLKAFEARTADRSGVYSAEQGDIQLDEASEAALKANEKAWTFFDTQAKTYKKAVIWWIISAKKPETKAKRLAQLIEESASEKRISQFVSPGKK
jgi:uncharacterized protein YdeI (YjbR/CyaY-like superfamily)